MESRFHFGSFFSLFGSHQNRNISRSSNYLRHHQAEFFYLKYFFLAVFLLSSRALSLVYLHDFSFPFFSSTDIFLYNDFSFSSVGSFFSFFFLTTARHLCAFAFSSTLLIHFDIISFLSYFSHVNGSVYHIINIFSFYLNDHFL
jgi:hypothetical protein